MAISVNPSQFDPSTRSIRKRDGETIQPFDFQKIERAVIAAWGSPPDEAVLQRVLGSVLGAVPDGTVDVEMIQDAVEVALMKHGHFDVAKSYIIYRRSRAEARALRDKKPDPKAISDYIHAAKYARYRPLLGRREVFHETVERTEKMHMSRFPHLSKEISEAFDLVREQRVLPSMRSMQFAGPPILQNHCKIFNCSFSLIDRLEAFSEGLFLLMCGCGVGYSVQVDHVEKLPPVGVVDAKRIQHHVVADTIEGWADALKALLQGYQDGVYVEFAYNLIRPAGAPLVTSGGKAPGHVTLKTSLEAIRKVMDGAQGRQLRPVECHRIMCHAAEAPLSGGVRRCLPKGTLVQTAKGLIPIERVQVGDRVRTTGVGNDVWGHVSDVLEQGTQSLVHIKTQMGVFKCTAKHRMAVMTSPTTYEFKMARDLEEGDRLVFIEGISGGRTTQLPKWKYTRREADKTSVDITIPNLDVDVAWFIGFLHGDGHVHVNRTDGSGGGHFVALAMNDLDSDTSEMVRRCRDVLSRFGVSVDEYKVKGENTRVVRSPGKQLALYFENFKKPNEPLEIPDFILQGTKEIRSAYLAGLFDSDGGAGNRPVMLVGSVYLDFLRHAQVLYASLGMPTRLTMNREAKGNWQALYHLSLVGEVPRAAFKATVEKESVKKIVDEYVSQRDYGYPREWIIDSGLEFDRMWAPQRKQMTLGTFDRCGGKRSAWIPITVFDVEETDETAETYDLTVDGRHEFVAGGLLTHNSAMIALFSLEDSEMMNVKTGDWYSREPWLANANNSVVLLRTAIDKKKFSRIFEMTKQWGEPGFYFTHDINYGANPCLEIGLDPRLVIDDKIKAKLAKKDIQVNLGQVHTGWAFCNLCEINAAKFKSIEDFMSAARAATFIGTLQATYTQMPYLGWISETIAERDALLGISMTGMLDAPAIACAPEAQRSVVRMVKQWNREFAALLGIESAARTTCVKPSGTASLELGGVGSGHHAHHAKRYFRRIIADELEPIFIAFKAKNPHMCVKKPDGKWVIEFPVEAPLGAIVKKDLSALEFLKMVLSTQQNWVVLGTGRDTHSPGLSHNVSNTVHVLPGEWSSVADFLFANRDDLTGVSLLPATADKQYAFAPNEEVTTEADETRWNNLVSSYVPLDYASLREETDETSLRSEAACAGGVCEVNV